MLLDLIIVFLVLLNHISIRDSLNGSKYIGMDERDLTIDIIKSAINAPNFQYEFEIKQRKLLNLPFSEYKTMFSKLIPCVNKYKFIMKTRVNKNIGAYVVKRISNAIFINANVWQDNTDVQKSKILIHECSHLMLNTLDYYYSFQDGFSSLRGYKANKNADTIASLIIDLGT